jgi:hypothetical protein
MITVEIYKERIDKELPEFKDLDKWQKKLVNNNEKIYNDIKYMILKRMMQGDKSIFYKFKSVITTNHVRNNKTRQ